MGKLVFSSDELPTELDDEARFKLWRDLFTEKFVITDFARAENRPFKSRWEFLQIDDTVLTGFDGTVVKAKRNRRQVAGDSGHDFGFTFNLGKTPWGGTQRDREITVHQGHALLFKTQAEACDFRFQSDNSWVGFTIPEKELLGRVSNAEDLILTPLDAASPAFRHLRRYVGILFQDDGLKDDPALSAPIKSTLFDLAALVLDARRDAAELARFRGLRAARLTDILAGIKQRFSEPDFSPQVLADRIGLSAHYIQKLLHETELTFSERVLELRLQKTRTMLADRKHDRLRIIDIAIACGFNEVSYFNRCFRRRFGATPTEWRGDRRRSEG